MKKPTVRRVLLGVVQHILAAVIVFTVMLLALSTQVRVEDMYGEYVRYRFTPFEDGKSFEDSYVFNDIFYNAVNDLTTLIVIKKQMETDGQYDGDKIIDVTSFVNRKGKISDCPITARFRLDDMLKWHKNGIETTTRTFTKKEFVTYFGSDILEPIYFYLDKNGYLQFKGVGGGYTVSQSMAELESAEGTDERKVIIQDKSAEYPYGSQYYAKAIGSEEYDLFVGDDEDLFWSQYNLYSAYDNSRLVDLVFDYLVANINKSIGMEEDSSGTVNVRLDMLVNRYVTEDGNGQLTGIADNWVDYFMLEQNVVNAVESIAYNYELYQKLNPTFGAENTNLQYLFRLGAGSEQEFYTNLPVNFSYDNDEDVNSYFSELGRYFVYSMEGMSYNGNASLDDNIIYDFLISHEYAFPGDTKLWVGLDTNYEKQDQFNTAFAAYSRIVPSAWNYAAVCMICGLGWLIICSYLTFTAGRAQDGEGNDIWYLNGFDKMYTEIALGIGAGCLVLGYYGASFLSYLSDSYVTDLYEKVFVYGCSILYGILASLTFCVMWYSLVRRIKSRNLWTGSLIYRIIVKIRSGIIQIICHHNTAIRTLIPYNIFLMLNLAGLYTSYVFRYYRFLCFLIVVIVLVLDAMVGVVLFRRNAEMVDIVEGINKIRQGEVEYKLDVAKLHGENKEIAEAVNNIGEGIRNAVATSMKDERMKADLITNVSHDIKTPLTSIVNYVDLLKREKITQEPIRSYIEILDSKSQRLKQLTDDLVEASKISSGNIVLEMEKLNLSELINQANGEFSEKFEEKKLTVVGEGLDQPACIMADSRRMWRVIENLFNNICKYAMPGTRVYIDMECVNGLVEIAIKNISQMQLNISPEELTERFIRGDESRTTEGSGLGLSIARNLVEAQEGTFRIYLDGDLFKVILRFPEYLEPEQTEEMQTEEE